ncbi:MAG: efflux RND transporter periplasmic adaptor subunit [Desulfuromonas sp.]|nr:MAG: efflux RND transporter periplasmic adaptor subunit [Desulfuromonas sp.]
MSTFRKSSLACLLLVAFMALSGSTALAETVEFDGLIEPNRVVEIGPPADGIVARVKVDRSSTVKKGQVLVELESSVQRAALKKARAMASFKGEIGLQETKLDYSKRVHNRLKNLQAISSLDKDQAETEIALTQYRLEKAREEHILAQLEMKRAQAVLGLRTVTSPISGVVVQRYVSPGEYVNNQPLLQLAQINPLRVEVIVPAHLFGKIEPEMTATILPELPEYGAQEATVTIVDKVIDSASNTFGVRLELPNEELQMPSGLKCLVRFEIDLEKTD